ncbi:MAG TPA: glycosyltransferase, partial [Terriglobia bacterium]|nr:glycosyltransferase [Terriglobia bacterium]
MLSLNHAYYFLKQYVPLDVRIGLRRWRARRRRRSFADVWPIDPKAGRTPPGWPGWPEGKRFAVVLTHDVEGRKGLARVERLMRLEQAHGFRSCFNFVPEGEYRVPDALRQALEQAGFEAGIHGLEHDGKLYASKKGFLRKAARIREYLRKWNIAGFRSPYMQHRLPWLHDLGVEYDASTFDTDPFEPEPDGMGTIFPFWVPGPGGSGFVELPYTLVQDFTLFVILREKTIELWKRKTDWIAERGGMLLLTTHPDYICFPGSEPSWDEYPAARYEELLEYLRTRYAGQYWQALPREVARHYRAHMEPQARNSRKKVCMVTYSDYESDGRVRRYAEALAKRGDLVEVISLAGKQAQPAEEQIEGVNVFRIQRRRRDERHKLAYGWRLLRFHLGAAALLTRRHHRIRYDLVHVHNIPDSLVFAAWYPKWTGARLILDIHDIVPELYANKFAAGSNHLVVKLLRRIEKRSMAFADHVIVSNHLWHQTLTARSVEAERCTVFLNHVDPAIFYPRPRTRNDGRIVIL